MGSGLDTGATAEFFEGQLFGVAVMFLDPEGNVVFLAVVFR